MEKKVQLLGGLALILFVLLISVIIMLLPKENNDNFVELDNISVNGIIYKDNSAYITINAKDNRVFVIDAENNRTFTFTGIESLKPEDVVNKEDNKLVNDLHKKGVKLEKSTFYYQINNIALTMEENGKATLYIRVDNNIRVFDLYILKTSYITDIAKKLELYNSEEFDDSQGNLYFTTEYQLARYTEDTNTIEINNEKFILPEEIKPYMGSMDGVESLISASNYSEVLFTQRNAKYIIPLPLNMTLSINNQEEISLYDEGSHSYNYISDAMTKDYNGKVILK